ncbi:MAG TPA: aspartate:alanine exchanger family transporter [Acidobacteriota bacterium]|nr:aspartate:alanine exchanger family transporter [Acidobacteriota bacterium]
MWEFIKHMLSVSPMFTVAVVLGLGYLFGQINFFGFRFGVAGVLFAGLAIGAMGKEYAIPEIVSTLGLAIFVYTMGLQSGKSFFGNLRHRGYRSNLLAAIALILGSLAAFMLATLLKVPGDRIGGLFCGALTSTPALAAAVERAHNNQPAIAYSVAYPFGVIGVLIILQLARSFFKPAIQPELTSAIHTKNFNVKNPAVMGRTIEELMSLHPEPGFVVSRVQHNGKIDVASPSQVLYDGDVVLAVGDEDSLRVAEQIFGQPSEVQLQEDRSKIDFRRIFVSNRAVVGRRIQDLDLGKRFQCAITRIRRGDLDLVPNPEMRLDFGDRVRVVAERSRIDEISKFFGDSIRGTAELDYGSVGIGIVLGILAGMIPIPLPSGGHFLLGIAGGTLLVALILGYMERTGPITWSMPMSANLTLREIGLILFLATVGTRAGYSFIDTLRNEGVSLLLSGAAITFTVTFSSILVGYKLLRIPFDELAGIVSGIHTQPAVLASAIKQYETERPNVGYASVYPVATVLKIILAQLLVTL